MLLGETLVYRLYQYNGFPKDLHHILIPILRLPVMLSFSDTVESTKIGVVTGCKFHKSVNGKYCIDILVQLDSSLDLNDIDKTEKVFLDNPEEPKAVVLKTKRKGGLTW